jgi:hypothetical protein
MLGIIAAVLIVLWLLGFFAFHVNFRFHSHCPGGGPHLVRAAFHEKKHGQRVERRPMPGPLQATEWLAATTVGVFLLDT